jgi:hypothetical protein
LTNAASACLALALLAVSLTSGNAAGAQTGGSELRGIAIDARTALPLRGGDFIATVGRDTVGTARSDSTGRFHMVMVGSATTVMVHVRKIGYRADSIAASLVDDKVLRIALDPSIATLASVVIKDSGVTAFERRARRSAGGHFIRLADIERLKPVQTTDLLRTIPGITFTDSGGTMRVLSQRNLRRTQQTDGSAIGGAHMPASDAERCAFRVGVDGRLMEADFFVNDIRPADIVAIEVYEGAATIPVEFSSVRRGSPCGLIMIWTKRGRDK